MKKILFVLHLPPPIHGAALVGKQIKDSEQINGEFIGRFLNLSTSRSIQEIGTSGITKIVRYFSLILSFVKLILFFRPDLVYITLNAKGVGFYKDSIFAIVALLFRKKVVYHFHNKGVRDRQDKFFDNILYRILFRKAYVILLSPFLYKDVSKYIGKGRVYFCPNGIADIADGSSVRGLARTTKGENTRNLLFLSNLIRTKGVFVLLEALAILKEKNVDFFCVFVGGEGDISANAFENKRKELGLSAFVTYVGKKYEGERTEYFRSADMFILPTMNDCFPLVLLEALQFSLPVVSTVEGAIPEIIENGVNGYLASPNNPDDLAEKIEHLLKNPEERLMMQQENRAKYENRFSLPVFENKLINILTAILDK